MIKMLTKAEIQTIRSLGDKKGRNAAGLFVAEGPKLVTELVAGMGMAAPLRVRRVLCTVAGAEHFGKAVRALRGGHAVGGPGDVLGEGSGIVRSQNSGLQSPGGWHGGPEVISHKEMERISSLKTPSDMLALVEIPRHGLSVRGLSGELSLALDGVQDPGNMGTILRLADWFGMRDVICSETTADCFNPKVVQATMGAIARVRVHYVPLARWLGEVRAAGIPVYGTFLDGEPIYDAALSPGGVIVMGSEGQGVSPEVAELVSRRLFIPPFPVGEPTSESLNVATATAIVCSEFRRRG